MLRFGAFFVLSFLVAMPALARETLVGDVRVPEGYTLTVAVDDLAGPTSLVFDESGAMLVAESGYGDSGEAEVTRVEADGTRTALVRESAFGENVPLTSIAVRDGRVFMAHGGAVSVLETTGELRTLATGLAGQGDILRRMAIVGDTLYVATGLPFTQEQVSCALNVASMNLDGSNLVPSAAIDQTVCVELLGDGGYVALPGDVSEDFVYEDRQPKVVKFDVATSMSNDVLVNNHVGPAYQTGTNGLERPIDVAVAGNGDVYVADWGISRATSEGVVLEEGSGVIWKLERGPTTAPFASGMALFFLMFGTFVALTLTYLAMRGGDRGVSALQGTARGILASIMAIVTAWSISYAVFKLPWYAPSRVFSAIFMGRAAITDMGVWNWQMFIVGTASLVALGAVLGALFSVLLRARMPSRVVVAGACFGLSAWVILHYFVLPFAFPIVAERSFPAAWMALLFVIFGTVLGWLVSRVPIVPSRRRTLRRRRSTRDAPLRVPKTKRV